jgi:hypothetical protein
MEGVVPPRQELRSQSNSEKVSGEIPWDALKPLKPHQQARKVPQIGTGENALPPFSLFISLFLPALENPSKSKIMGKM